MSEVSQKAEQEIAELERMLAEKRAALKRQKEAGTVEELPHPKEILREIVRMKIAAAQDGGASAPTVTPPQPQPQPSSPVRADIPSYELEELRPKVQELVEHAFQKSLDDAIKIAKAADNAALLDAFHDIIVDELYNYLVESKKLKEVA